MFYKAIHFNEPIEQWNISNVNSTFFMFGHAKDFNQCIGNWDISNVSDMRYMFCGASNFDKSLKNWNVNDEKVEIANMFNSCKISPVNCPNYHFESF